MKTTKLFLASAVCASMLLAGCAKTGGEDKPKTYTVAVTSGGNGTAKADKTTAAEGETVTLTAENPADGYTFDKWTVLSGGVTCSPGESANPATFTMPAANVSIEAGFVSSKPGAKYGIETVLIPKGTFQMGSARTQDHPIAYPHFVTLTKDFLISKYEITNAQYATFLNTNANNNIGLYRGNAYENPDSEDRVFLVADSSSENTKAYNWGINFTDGKWVPSPGYDDHPVIWVSWPGAARYAEWVGGSLPTEAQWEYACCGDYPNKATETQTKLFGVGDGTKLYADMANFSGNHPYDEAYGGWIKDYDGSYGHPNTDLGKTSPVGSYPPNNYGLYDMHGNVWEWVSDYYNPNYGIDYITGEGSEPVTDPTGPDEPNIMLNDRIGRGGSYYYCMATSCSSSYRFDRPGHGGYSAIGFRVVFEP